MAQDDGVVNGQGKLQHYGDGVRNVADGSAKVVGAHVQQRGSAEGHQQHRHFHIRSGGQGQHDDDDHHADYQDSAHFFLQQCVLIVAHHGINRQVIIGKLLLDLLQRVQAHLVKIAPGETHIIQGGGVGVVGGSGIECDRIHAVDGAQDVRELCRCFVGHIRYHDLGGAECDKILIHGGQTLPGLCLIGQIGGDIIFHIHPVHGKNTENEGKGIQQEEQIPFIHDKRGYLFKETAGRPLVHKHPSIKLLIISKSYKCCILILRQL